MDGYYSAQVSMPYFQGSARQRGRGLGTLALAVGRTAIPIFKKFILPAAKRMGKIALETAAPELLDIASGYTTPKAAFKRVAKTTVKRQLGNGPKKQKKKIIRKKNSKKPVRRQSSKKSKKKTRRQLVDNIFTNLE